MNKGPETPDTFARRVLEDLYDRLPIMVMNDEGSHCWRPAASVEDFAAVDTAVDKDEAEEARVWLDGLDRINNCTANPGSKPGVSICLDLSATPFYLKGSGYPEGRPFPWIVSDFGLVDAIESGIVKIPRLPVLAIPAAKLACNPNPRITKRTQSHFRTPSPHPCGAHPPAHATTPSNPFFQPPATPAKPSATIPLWPAS